MAASLLPNLHETAAFVEVAQVGTFSEAGRRLHISQPAVSRAIGGLDRQVGTHLSVRQHGAAQLTEAGEALLPATPELVGASRILPETMITSFWRK